LNFKPTFLYVKHHAITGMLYFGKTVKKNPLTYNGSGLYWKLHLETHGLEHVETLWYCLFHDKEECTKFALMFSEQQDIVNSNQWANLIIEDGVGSGGHTTGFTDKKHSEESLEKMSLAKLGKKKSAEHCASIKAARIGKTHSPESKAKMAAAKIGNSNWKGKQIDYASSY
jgi:hypothetical protein